MTLFDFSRGFHKYTQAVPFSIHTDSFCLQTLTSKLTTILFYKNFCVSITNRSLVGTLLTTGDDIFQHTLPYCQIIEWFRQIEGFNLE